MLEESSENIVQSPKPNTSLVGQYQDYFGAKCQFAESTPG